MTKSKQTQQQYARSWIGQTHLDEFFSGSLTQTQVTKQPIIDVESVSDIELDTIELIDSEAALDIDQPSMACSPSCWGCQCLNPEIQHVIYTENFAQNFGTAKKAWE